MNNIEQENILKLKSYGVAFGEKIILSSINLSISQRDVFVLILYVAQNSKLLISTVLKNSIDEPPEGYSLTKLQQVDVCKRLLRYSGLSGLTEDLDRSEVDLPSHLQRHLTIVRSTASNQKLLCIDEPTADLEEQHCYSLIDFIICESKKRAMLVVENNQKHVKRLGVKTALLAGGWIHESDTIRIILKIQQQKLVSNSLLQAHATHHHHMQHTMIWENETALHALNNTRKIEPL